MALRCNQPLVPFCGQQCCHRSLSVSLCPQEMRSLHQCFGLTFHHRKLVGPSVLLTGWPPVISILDFLHLLHLLPLTLKALKKMKLHATLHPCFQTLMSESISPVTGRGTQALCLGCPPALGSARCWLSALPHLIFPACTFICIQTSAVEYTLLRWRGTFRHHGQTSRLFLVGSVLLRGPYSHRICPCFQIGSQQVAQVGHRLLAILLCPPPACWDRRHGPLRSRRAGLSFAAMLG